MSRNIDFYSQAACTITVDGRPLTDLMDGDDAIAVEWEGDRATLTQGMDSTGLSIASITGGYITVKLKPTSPEAGWLNRMFENQKTTPRVVDIVMSSGTREILTAEKCAIASKETYNFGGPTMQGRGYRFACTNIIDDVTEG